MWIFQFTLRCFSTLCTLENMDALLLIENKNKTNKEVFTYLYLVKKNTKFNFKKKIYYFLFLFYYTNVMGFFFIKRTCCCYHSFFRMCPVGVSYKKTLICGNLFVMQNKKEKLN